MRFLTPQQLDEILLEGIEVARQKDLFTFNTFRLLYDTGIRIGELDIERWVSDNNGSYLLRPQKWNHIREFSIDELPSTWVKTLEHGAICTYNTTRTTRDRRFAEMFRGMYFKTQRATLKYHVFRHNYAKKMHLKLNSNSAVRRKMGEVHLTSALQYISSEIEYLPKLLPTS